MAGFVGLRDWLVRHLGLKPRREESRASQEEGSGKRMTATEARKDTEPAAGPELFFAFVSAAGTDLRPVTTALEDALGSVQYNTTLIRLSELLSEIPAWPNLAKAPEDDRVEQHMEAGTQFRERLDRGDALAAWGLVALREKREELTGDEKEPAPRRAFVVRSLKRLEEAQLLRRLYGPSFVLVSAYSPRERRVDDFAAQITASRYGFDPRQYRARAEELIQTDELEVGRPLGQNVSRVFPKADVFIDASKASDEINDAVRRFVELLFGNPFHTPSRDEFGMFQAHAAALRSSDLGRQVGAAIATKSGEVVALGSNDVPKAGGGLYWAGDVPDSRDFHRDHDPSHQRVRSLVADIFDRLQKENWLTGDRAAANLDQLVDQALYGPPKAILAGSQMLSVVEFFRAVHAEMAALMDAARRGVSVKDCTLYSTTFPCHDCAKHIVAAGIDRVVYVEPYPKSLVADMYSDSIAVDKPEVHGKVSFEPFVGVAPIRYIDLFTADERKGERGKIVKWEGRGKLPRVASASLGYIAQEDAVLQSLLTAMKAAGLSPEEASTPK